MTETLPPLRTTHVFAGPRGQWGYDSWGMQGRPVVLVHAVLFDRTSWWPTAADLRPHAAVIAVDLPAHGLSARRDRYEPDEIVDDLAALIASLQLRRAPVIVSHGCSVVLATLFAARYATQAVVAVDPVAPAELSMGTDAYLRKWNVGALPAQYRDLVYRSHDPNLLTAYAAALQEGRPSGTTSSVTSARMAVYSRATDHYEPREGVGEPWRHERYDVPGRFAHLTAVSRFISDLKTLL